MIRCHGAIFCIVMLLIAATAASSQDRPHASLSVPAPVAAGSEALAGSEQSQASREHAQAAAQQLAATPESSSAGADAWDEQLRSLLASSMLALSQVEREDRQDRLERTRPLGSGWSYGADRSGPPRFGRGPRWGMPGRGRPFGAGRRGRGGNRF